MGWSFLIYDMKAIVSGKSDDDQQKTLLHEITEIATGYCRPL